MCRHWKCNRLWRTICSNHMELDSRHVYKVYCELQTMHTLVKTHKSPPDTSYSCVNLEDMKVRPIVSCCDSPYGEVGLDDHRQSTSSLSAHCWEKFLFICTTSTVTSTFSADYQRVNLKDYSSSQQICQLCLPIWISMSVLREWLNFYQHEVKRFHNIISIQHLIFNKDKIRSNTWDMDNKN
jgi:hypothetical protein